MRWRVGVLPIGPLKMCRVDGSLYDYRIERAAPLHIGGRRPMTQATAAPSCSGAVTSPIDSTSISETISLYPSTATPGKCDSSN